MIHLHLPIEILLYVCKYLKNNDLFNLSICNTVLYTSFKKHLKERKRKFARLKRLINEWDLKTIKWRSKYNLLNYNKLFIHSDIILISLLDINFYIHDGLLLMIAILLNKIDLINFLLSRGVKTSYNIPLRNNCKLEALLSLYNVSTTNTSILPFIENQNEFIKDILIKAIAKSNTSETL